MTYTLVLLIAVVAISIALGCVFTPMVVDVAHKLHLYDQPNMRKVHTLPIPRLGGLAFLPSIIIAVGIVVTLSARLGFTYHDLTTHGVPQHFIAYLAGALILYALGIIDDIHGASYKLKFVAQIVAATLLCISGLWFGTLGHVFYIDRLPFWIGMPLTILFIVYVTNAINLIDGIDGLASGLSILSFAVIAVLCVLAGDIVWAMIALAYMGVLCVFFAYNVFGKKNKIFMGDAGSMTLGYTLSFLLLHFWQAEPIWNPIIHNLGIIAMSTIVIPMLDVVRVFASRVRDGRNPFLPDKNHIHHKLMRTGLSGRKTLLALLLMSLSILVINYLCCNISQTLMVVMDVAIFVIMHYTINFFIRKREAKTGEVWDRVL